MRKRQTIPRLVMKFSFILPPHPKTAFTNGCDLPMEHNREHTYRNIYSNFLFPCIPGFVLVPGFEPSVNHFRRKQDRALFSSIQSSLPKISTSNGFVKEKQICIREYVQAPVCKLAVWAINRLLNLKRRNITKTTFFTNIKIKFFMYSFVSPCIYYQPFYMNNWIAFGCFHYNIL